MLISQLNLELGSLLNPPADGSILFRRWPDKDFKMRSQRHMPGSWKVSTVRHHRQGICLSSGLGAQGSLDVIRLKTYEYVILHKGTGKYESKYNDMNRWM